MAATKKTAELDAPLHAIGFEIDLISATEVNGRLTVTEICCQPFGVLHGGISALIAEALASMGGHVASGFSRVAGVQLSINHHRSAPLGSHIFARAVPVNVGRTIQVWEVCMWKTDPGRSSDDQEKGAVLIASSKVTLFSNMSVPENAKNVPETFRKHAKL